MHWGWDGTDFNDGKLAKVMKATKFATDALDASKCMTHANAKLKKNQILDSKFIQKHPEFLVDCMAAHYFCGQVGHFFMHDKILDLLKAADKKLPNVDLMINRKAYKDILIKICFRGGRLDDIHRAMFLIPTNDQQAFNSIVNFLDEGCLEYKLDYVWEDDQAKASWPCIKFLLFDPTKRLNG